MRRHWFCMCMLPWLYFADMYHPFGVAHLYPSSFTATLSPSFVSNAIILFHHILFLVSYGADDNDTMSPRCEILSDLCTYKHRKSMKLSTEPSLLHPECHDL